MAIEIVGLRGVLVEKIEDRAAFRVGQTFNLLRGFLVSDVKRLATRFGVGADDRMNGGRQAVKVRSHHPAQS